MTPFEWFLLAVALGLVAVDAAAVKQVVDTGKFPLLDDRQEKAVHEAVEHSEVTESADTTDGVQHTIYVVKYIDGNGVEHEYRSYTDPRTWPTKEGK